jgi:hypothetical protein
MFIVKKSLKIPKGNQKPWIEEGQRTQWPKERKGEQNTQWFIEQYTGS